MHDVRLQPIYDSQKPEGAKEAEPGLRILVDRLWPRGVSKEAAALDHWLKEVAPSHGLRKWFAHRQERWGEFRRRYDAELADDPARRAAFEQLRELAADEPVVLLYATKAPAHHAQHLAERLRAED